MDPKLRLGAAKCIRLDKIAPQTAHKSRKWDRAAQNWHHLGTSTPKLPLRSNKLQKRGELPQKYRQKTGQNHPPPPSEGHEAAPKWQKMGQSRSKKAPNCLQNGSTSPKTAPHSSQLHNMGHSCPTSASSCCRTAPKSGELHVGHEAALIGGTDPKAAPQKHQKGAKPAPQNTCSAAGSRKGGETEHKRPLRAQSCPQKGPELLQNRIQTGQNQPPPPKKETLSTKSRKWDKTDPKLQHFTPQ